MAIEDDIRRLGACIAHGDEEALDELLRLEKRRWHEPKTAEHEIDTCGACPWAEKNDYWVGPDNFHCMHPDWVFPWYDWDGSSTGSSSLLSTNGRPPPGPPPDECPLRKEPQLLYVMSETSKV